MTKPRLSDVGSIHAWVVYNLLLANGKFSVVRCALRLPELRLQHRMYSTACVRMRSATLLTYPDCLIAGVSSKVFGK